ncbi:aldo/keto reductase [Isoptericola chiayiensis]|uniref:Aldo/keto reductase n=1 Tax=Isoptericola chiayiensis TaxID=579446 RepID=A0ABP8Y933_9MICO|nr:aldo/keto reductase [Isoptericola chiayiensis]NOW00795.1 2,5-diketo-D-gluconate reductase A [Isoptericola chiayiensis]
MSTEQQIPDLLLNSGVSIPQLGFGTFQIPPEQTRDVVAQALDIGYRHIDTAQMYRNERGVGEALAESGLDRDDVFVTSKLNNAFHAHDDALAAFDKTLKELHLEHVDLFLIHWPLPKVDKYVEAWGALEEIYRSGRARAIGVSNFEPHHLRRLMDESTVVPAVNQIEVHPWLGNEDVRAVDAEHGIVTEAWSPLGRGAVLEDPTIVRIAGNLDRTPAQVVLRWHIERGDVIFPKSVTPERIKENFALFDFELSEADMADITALDRGERVGSHPDEMNNTGR